MRYTKVSSMSYFVALILLGVAAAFATWRARDEAPRVDPGSGLWSAGREKYAAECAACHSDPATIAIDGDWRPLAELLLAGDARLIRHGETRPVKRHPTFEDNSDERLAAIVGYVSHLHEGPSPGATAPTPTPADIQAIRSSLRLPPGPK